MSSQMNQQHVADGALEVLDARMVNPITRLIRLGPERGATLPEWTPGSHIKVQVKLPDGSMDWRHYSLIDFEGVTDGAPAGAACYTIAVRREDKSRGGSAFMHDVLKVGDLLPFQFPSNNFQFEPAQGETIFVAGGIGITPLVSMIRACAALQRSMHLYFAGRSRELMAFLDSLGHSLGDKLTVHADDEHAGAFFDIEGLLDKVGVTDRVFLCGPKPMLDAALEAAKKRQWEADRLRFELFTVAEPEAGDRPFEIVLAQSGETLTVPADQSILDCLIEHGHDPLYDCTRGECGVCTVPVLEGEIDHRDYVLTDSEKSSGSMMQICVSRAKGDKLVLDI